MRSFCVFVVLTLSLCGNAQFFKKQAKGPHQPSIYINMSNNRIITERHRQLISTDDIISVHVRQDSAFFVFKPGVWERADSIYKTSPMPSSYSPTSK